MNNPGERGTDLAQQQYVQDAETLIKASFQRQPELFSALPEDEQAELRKMALGIVQTRELSEEVVLNDKAVLTSSDLLAIATTMAEDFNSRSAHSPAAMLGAPLIECGYAILSSTSSHPDVTAAQGLITTTTRRIAELMGGSQTELAKTNRQDGNPTGVETTYLEKTRALQVDQILGVNTSIGSITTTLSAMGEKKRQP